MGKKLLKETPPKGKPAWTVLCPSCGEEVKTDDKGGSNKTAGAVKCGTCEEMLVIPKILVVFPEGDAAKTRVDSKKDDDDDDDDEGDGDE